MFALKKLRARRRPANQAHVTNLKENPALLAADAAEAAARGFAEVETTVGVARYAPLNAIAILVGSQTGRPGVMTQCAVEERRNLQLAIQGLVTYAETLSVYGTEPVFVDGDDTPWSKAFLASAYASRGVKVRFTSGSGSEALMGARARAARCSTSRRAASPSSARPARRASRTARSRASRSSLSVPGGTRAILAENVLAAWLDLEVASGNDAIASPLGDPQDGEADGPVPARHRLRHVGLLGDAAVRQHVRRRQLRRRRPRRVADDPARLAGRRRHRAAGGGGRRRRARARRRARSRPSSRSSASRRSRRTRSRLAATGYDSTRPAGPRPRRRRRGGRPRAGRGDLRARRRPRARRRGFGDVAEAVFGMQRQRVAADYLQTSAVIGADGAVVSAVNDPNDYSGPGTGYRLEGERWALLSALPHAFDAARLGGRGGAEVRAVVEERGEAAPGDDPDEVVVAVGPAFGDCAARDDQRPAAPRTCSRRSATASARAAARRASCVCVASPTSPSSATTARGSPARASPSASSRRERRSSTAPTCSRSTTSSSSAWRRSTRSTPTARSVATPPATRCGEQVGPVPTEIDNFARAKLIVRTTLLHARETQAVVPGAPAVELALRATPRRVGRLRPRPWACRRCPSAGAARPGRSPRCAPARLRSTPRAPS